MFSNEHFLNISFDSENNTQDISIEQQIPDTMKIDSYNILFSKNFQLLKTKYKKEGKSVLNFEDLKKHYYLKKTIGRYFHF